VEPAPRNLPAGFDHEELLLDEAGKKDREIFIKEVERARRALSQSGLVDSEGDLTRSGKEVEKYPGEASNAYALALSDQMACLHEVALALATLGSNVLHGKKANCILRLSPDWPDEWCARAATCHAALAKGCKDDLDLAIRIGASYQDAENKALWCQIWWVNQSALEKALHEVDITIASQSQAMKSTPSRRFEEDLAYRARAVLSRAFAANRYKRTPDGKYKSIEDESLPAARIGTASYGEESDFRIFFQRFKLSGKSTRDDAPPRLILGHFMNFLPEAIAGKDADLSALDLVITARRAKKEDSHSVEGSTDPFRNFRERVPIGSKLRLRLGERPDGDFDVTQGKLISFPFLAPIEEDGGANDDPGIDPDWNPWRELIPGDSRDTEDIEDLAEIENNEDWLGSDEEVEDIDGPVSRHEVSSSWPPVRLSIPREFRDDLVRLLGTSKSLEAGENSPQPGSSAEANASSEALKSGNQWLVADYEWDGEVARLVLDPCDEWDTDLDPRIDAAEEFLDEVCVIYCGEVQAREGTYVRFWQEGSFRFFSIPKYLLSDVVLFSEVDDDFTFPNSKIPAHIVVRQVSARSKENQFSLTFASALRDAVNAIPKTSISIRRQEHDVVRARVCEVSQLENKVVAEFDNPIGDFGFRLRFSFPLEWVGEDSGIGAAAFDPLVVSLHEATPLKQKLGVYDPDHRDVFASFPSMFNLIKKGDAVEVIGPIDLSVAQRLASFGQGAGLRWWQIVSYIFERSNMLKTGMVWGTPERSAELRDEVLRELREIVQGYDHLERDAWDEFGEQEVEHRILEIKEHCLGMQRAFVDQDRSFCLRACGCAKGLIKNRMQLKSNLDFRNKLNQRIANLEDKIAGAWSETFRNQHTVWLMEEKRKWQNLNERTSNLENWIAESEEILGI
jgi:hypothetical protein